jgi:hypothetical protein
MFIGFRYADHSWRVLVIRRLGAKIIKREDLDLTGVGGRVILVGHGHS